MIISVSILTKGMGAAMPWTFVNFSISGLLFQPGHAGLIRF
jgi:hypothetical protein